MISFEDFRPWGYTEPLTTCPSSDISDDSQQSMIEGVGPELMSFLPQILRQRWTDTLEKDR